MADTKQKDEKADEALRPGESEEAIGAAAPRAGIDSGTAPGMAAERQAPVGGARGSSLGAAGAGAIHTVGDIGGNAVGATRNVVRGAIGATEEVGSDLVGGVAHIATDLVHGVTDLGYEVRNGATGLIGAVGDIGGAAVNTVAHLLVDVVGGVRQVVAAAVGRQEGTVTPGPERPSESERGESGARAHQVSRSTESERTVRH